MKVVVQHGFYMTGFTFLKYASRCFVAPINLDFADNDPDSERVVNYSKETIDLVKRELCAIKVVCFNRGLNLSVQFRILHEQQFRRSSPLSQEFLRPQEVLDVRYQALPPGLAMHCGVWFPVPSC